jgi:hypothetical protein
MTAKSEKGRDNTQTLTCKDQVGTVPSAQHHPQVRQALQDAQQLIHGGPMQSHLALDLGRPTRQLMIEVSGLPRSKRLVPASV